MGRDKGRLSDLSAARVARRLGGEKPLCGSPIQGSKDPKHVNYGKTCRSVAGNGTDHYLSGNCSRHGGNMKPNKTVAAREVAGYEVARFRKDQMFYGSHVEIGFGEALLEEMQRSVGIVRWIEGKLSAWGTDPEAMDRDGTPTGWDKSTGLPPMMEVHEGYRSLTVSDSEYAAWMRQLYLERRHLLDVAKAGVASGIAKDLVEITKMNADRMYRVLMLACQKMDMDPDRVVVVLPDAIREITGKQAS